MTIARKVVERVFILIQFFSYLRKQRWLFSLGALKRIHPWVRLNGLFGFCTPWNCQKIIDILMVLGEGWSLTGLLELVLYGSVVQGVFHWCYVGIPLVFYQGHKGQNSANLMLWLFGLGISMSWFWSLGISMSWLFVLWKNALESRCRGLFVSVSRCRGFLVLESRCRGFLVLESRCHGFLVLESRCRGICASTASFSFSLNLLCHIINVNMWVVNYANYFVSHKLVF